MKELCGALEMFHILIWVVIIQGLKTHLTVCPGLVHFTCCNVCTLHLNKIKLSSNFSCFGQGTSPVLLLQIKTQVLYKYIRDLYSLPTLPEWSRRSGSYLEKAMKIQNCHFSLFANKVLNFFYHNLNSTFHFSFIVSIWMSGNIS